MDSLKLAGCNLGDARSAEVFDQLIRHAPRVASGDEGTAGMTLERAINHEELRPWERSSRDGINVL
jgi:hypothetical protein